MKKRSREKIEIVEVLLETLTYGSQIFSKIQRASGLSSKFCKRYINAMEEHGLIAIRKDFTNTKLKRTNISITSKGISTLYELESINNDFKWIYMI